MAAPYLFIGLPLLMAPVVYGLRRRAILAPSLAIAATLLLALAALTLPVDQPLSWLGGRVIRSGLSLLGRAFTLEPADRLALAFMFVQTAALYGAVLAAPQGRFFLAFSLASLGLLAAALFVQPFVFAALFLQIAAGLGVFLLNDERHANSRGGLRYLVFMTLGMPFVLFSGWLIENSALNPEDPSFALRATILLAVGFSILLAVAPFHSWLPAAAEHAPPLAAAFIFSTVQFVLVFLLLTFMDTYDWLRGSPLLERGLTVAGGAMVLGGAGLAFGQHNLGRAVGYVMMIDIGAVLLAVGLGTGEGIQAALAALAMRGLALPLWALGLDQLRRLAGGDDFERLRGLAWRQPLAAASLLAGALSLVGFPLTAGFPARWALLRLLAQIHPTGALLLLAGMGSVGFVCLRLLASLVAPAEDDEPWDWRAEPLSNVLLGVGLAANLLLGAFPQWTLTLISQTAVVFTNLGP